MSYNPEIPRNRYDNYGDREWTRLEKDGHGELLYQVHFDILKRYVKPTDRVLEIGAGSGRYTKDLAIMCSELTVADLSSHQIEFNKAKMRDLSLSDRIKAYHVLDVLDMGIFEDSSFDCVVCIGGVINYLLDKENDGIQEMLRVLKPNGILIVGAMSFIGASLYYLEGIRYEKDQFGMEATKWLMHTGVQDEEHYPVPSKHFIHMMRSTELDALFASFSVRVQERSSAGLYTQAGDSALDHARNDPEFWKLIVEKEIEFTKLPGTLDAGMNLIYVVQKL
ncbi:class I SAM-dependent methyltransferase [Paenibacillus silvae]|uniref:class I SAM-dependent methyltransferase n=1 Tax=Paenibacillus silvae TaxID=1325358 RepID=UPI002004F92D|nr:class I SAM-dependent methyltransferase [Paenibacillus silvae]MCK6073257.1 class I SAM-dependent methyltransferase [Paenibacillus silvae]MCK6149267.1 class I SAM-dependent methyltransferase [Paenibacillus silvae]MCK6267566.1 class I SAM-dependent methyltransferase [Paenibacillus silvae]